MNTSSRDLEEAIAFVRGRFAQWQSGGKISDEQLAQIDQTYDVWRQAIDPNGDYSAALPQEEVCLADLEEVERERRLLVFLQRELTRHASEHRVTHDQATTLAAEVSGRLAEIGEVLAGRQVAASLDKSQRTFLEYLLDPRSLHVMMITGGDLLVLGLVVWMWSIGVFENPKVVAVTLGMANLSLLAGGAALVQYSRYQTAGRAITLLACLVLPLNLWFYDAQGLITLANGGHLWVPALVCCVLYAAIARLLKDPLFVYTLVAGIAMTGLLFLADQQVGRFWEVFAPSTFLVVLGVLAVHVERLFAEGDGPFSRQKFGRAFFVAGHITMAIGLVVLLCGRLVGWFYNSIFAGLDWFPIPDVAVVPAIKLCALLLALLGTYTYVYSHLVANHRDRRYAYSAVMMLLWSEVILLDLLNVTITETVVLLVLASTGLAAHAAASVTKKVAAADDHLGNALGGVGTACTAIAVAWGGLALLRGWFVAAGGTAAFELVPLFGLAMLVTVAACGVAARRERARNNPRAAETCLQAIGLPLVAATATGLAMLGMTSTTAMLPLLALVPLALLLAGSRAAEDSPLAQLSPPAYTATMFLLLLSVGAAAGWSLASEPLARFDHLLLAGFYAIAAAAMGLTAWRNRATLAAALAGVSGSAAVWQLLTYAGFAEYAPMVAASAVGLATMLIARLLPDRDSQQIVRLASIGAAIVVVGAAGGLLITTERLITNEATWGLLGLAIGQALTALIAALLIASPDWKTTTRTLAGLHAAAGGAGRQHVVEPDPSRARRDIHGSRWCVAPRSGTPAMAERRPAARPSGRLPIARRLRAGGWPAAVGNVGGAAHGLHARVGFGPAARSWYLGPGPGSRGRRRYLPHSLDHARGRWHSGAVGGEPGSADSPARTGKRGNLHDDRRWIVLRRCGALERLPRSAAGDSRTGKEPRGGLPGTGVEMNVSSTAGGHCVSVGGACVSLHLPAGVLEVSGCR